jgi:erythromycin esterase-like protein
VRHKQGIPSLGKNLATLRGTDYVALALVLGGGRVRAAYVPDGEYRAYEIDDPPEGSVPDVFGRVAADQLPPIAEIA